MLCTKQSLYIGWLKTVIIFAIIGPIIQISVDFISLDISNENINDITVSGAHAIAQDIFPVNPISITRIIIIQIVSYQRFKIIHDNNLSNQQCCILFINLILLIINVILNISDIIQLLFDTNNFSDIHFIAATVLFIAAPLYQLIHTIITFIIRMKIENNNSFCKTFIKFKIIYLFIITLITIITILLFLVNQIILDNGQVLVEWIAVIAINIYYFGFVPFFVEEIDNCKFRMPKEMQTTDNTLPEDEAFIQV